MIFRPRISFTLLVVRTEAMSLGFRSFLVELLKSVVNYLPSTAEWGPLEVCAGGSVPTRTPTTFISPARSAG